MLGWLFYDGKCAQKLISTFWSIKAIHSRLWVAVLSEFCTSFWRRLEYTSRNVKYQTFSQAIQENSPPISTSQLRNVSQAMLNACHNIYSVLLLHSRWTMVPQKREQSPSSRNNVSVLTRTHCSNNLITIIDLCVQPLCLTGVHCMYWQRTDGHKWPIINVSVLMRTRCSTHCRQ